DGESEGLAERAEILRGFSGIPQDSVNVACGISRVTDYLALGIDGVGTSEVVKPDAAQILDNIAGEQLARFQTFERGPRGDPISPHRATGAAIGNAVNEAPEHSRERGGEIVT